MKILHIMHREKFTKGICQFYDRFFSVAGHSILYVNNVRDNSMIDPSLSIVQNELFLNTKQNTNTNFVSKCIKNICAIKTVRYFTDAIGKYDYVVFHSCHWVNSQILWLSFALSNKVLRKIVWIEWGGDLYNRNRNSNRIANWAIKRVKSNCNTVVCIFPPDCKVYKKTFPESKAKVFYAPYCGATVPEEYKHYSNMSRLEQTLKDKDYLLVQIGHSATRELNHIEAIEKLSRYRDENIRLLIPLSYGDTEYADMVAEKAIEIFKDKAIILRDFMPADEYFGLTKRVDIAIFNTYRQIGLGNIHRLLFRNVKTYIPENSVMYDYFMGTGVAIQKFSDLGKISFEEFAKPAKTQHEQKFLEYIHSLSDEEAQVKLWQNVYDDLHNRLNNKQK